MKARSKEQKIENAKKYAQQWNEFRRSCGSKEFSLQELKDLASMTKLPYAWVMITELTHREILQQYQKRGKWHFSGELIHYMLFISISERQVENSKMRRIEKNVLETTLVPDIKETENREFSWSDEQLVAELRARGYEVKATKTIEL